MKATLHGTKTELEYRALPGIRSSHLKAGLRSMAHLKHALEKGDEPENEPGTLQEADPEKGLVFGNFFHAFLLEPMDKVLERYQFPTEERLNWSTTAGKAQKASLIAANKPVVFSLAYSVAEAMRESVHASPFWPIMEKMRACTEMAITGDVNGVGLKCKLDLFDPESCTVVNLKTTRDGHPRSFDRDAWKLAYWLQAAVECTLVEQLTGHTPTYFWSVIEKWPPYNFQVYQFDTVQMKLAQAKLYALLGRYEEAVKNNDFTGYAPRGAILPYKLPAYAMEGESSDLGYTPEE